eukprot:TRINITY_DN3883_c0_g1_i1.p1 TRINITY_DN3883_c0_g1~~TRINITY_DN3883_c0_g1_i1.p1  ORF type:complete len:712 (-),score=149.62 TRINITY_DN3883_c0_g1_i1:412-2502(-)
MDGVEDAPTFVLGGVRPGAALGMSWGPGNRIAIYGTKYHGHQEKDKHPRNGNIRIASWDRSIGVRRKLISESYGPFLALQIAMRQIPQTELRYRTRPLVTACHHYRTFAREVSSSIRDKPDDPQSLALISAQTAEIALHLAEIIFLTPLVPAAPCMFDWLEWHFPIDPTEAGADFAQLDRPESSDAYWHLIYRLVMRGKMQEARRLLELHSEGGNAFLGVVKDSLGGQPSFQLFFSMFGDWLCRMPAVKGAFSSPDQLTKFKQWQESLSEFAKAHPEHFQEHNELALIVRITQGNPHALAEVADDWKELLVASLIFCEPEMKTGYMDRLFKDCVDTKPQSFEDDPLGMLCDAAFRNSVDDFVREVYELGDLWLTAHLLDLLHHRGILKPRLLPEHNITQRQHALFEYAYGIATDDVNPHVIVEYILESDIPNSGPLIEQILSRIVPLRTERDARKMTALLEKVNIDEATKRRILHRVNRITSRAFISRGLVGPAIAWTISSNAGTSDSVSQHLSDRLLDSVVLPLAQVDLPHHLNLVRVVDSLGLNHIMAKYVGLKFLRLYRDVCQRWLEGDRVETLRLLVEAVTTSDTPRRFWLVLLRDCARLMSDISSQTLHASGVTSHSILDLMRCLEEVHQSHDREQLLSGFASKIAIKLNDSDAMVNIDVEIEEIRRSLTQALSYALMLSGQTSAMERRFV